jgi:hypothetical protein
MKFKIGAFVVIGFVVLCALIIGCSSGTAIGCCSAVVSCPAGQVCLRVDDHRDYMCVPEPDPGECWDGDFTFGDCDWDAGEICKDQHYCGCKTHCDKPLQIGHCYLPKYTPCCEKVDECKENEICYLPKWEENGSCIPALSAGQCWDELDCPPDQMCHDANACGCGAADCTAKPGTCGPMAEDCCKKNEDCGNGQLCTAPLLEPRFGAGKCVTLNPPECYFDTGCEKDQVCLYPTAFPCNQQPPMNDITGQCTTIEGIECWDKEQCPDGYMCEKWPSDSSGACLPQPAPGQCYSPADCDEGQFCPDGQICIGVPCTDDGKFGKLGTCIVQPAGCCVENFLCPDQSQI